VNDTTSASPQETRPTVVIYGNCQADAATTIFNRHPSFRERFRAIFYPSYDHPTIKPEDISPADVAACAVLLEQHDPVGFPLRQLLPAGIRVVTFPSLDFNLLWPLTCPNPFDTRTAGRNYGIFPYGDRVILTCVKRGMNADDILQYYLRGWDDYKVDLGRLTSIETARIAQRDEHCDVQFGSLVLERFRVERLFWTVNHPAAPLLAQMTTKLLAAAFPGEPWAQCDDMFETIVGNFSPYGPLGSIDVPIHPDVADYLGLSWYRYEEGHRLSDGRVLSYEQYFRELIAQSVEGHAQEGARAPAG
jgi:hypothetical protein